MVTRWLITGGCGFIGRSLIKRLINDRNHQICIIDNLSVGSRKDLEEVCQFKEVGADSLLVNPGSVNLVVADILDSDIAVSVAKGMDIIVHLAANTGVPASVHEPRKDCMVNVIGTLNYLESARINDVKRFVLASSSAPIGECKPPIHEEMPAHPLSPYGASKLAGEGYSSAYYHSYGLETVSLRFSNVYGPLSSKKSSVVAKFIKRAIEKKPLEIYGDGTQTRDFIYIDDLIDAILKAATISGIGGEIYQIASEREITISYLAELLVAKLKEKRFENKLTVIHEEERIGDVKKNFSITDKAFHMLNWRATVSLEEGLKETIKWFLNSRKI